MQSVTENKEVIWRSSSGLWIFVFVVAALLGITFYIGIREMIHVWNVREEYSYGYLIPFITLFLIWQRKNVVEGIPFSGSWVGVLVVAFGLMLFFLGSLSTIKTIVQYALLIVVIGSALAIMTWKGLKPVFIPLLFLAFMVPLPGVFLNNLSSQLQLLSSDIGVGITRLFGISVYLEGNVIDLGSYKLQVVEACSGLRYLFPLMALSFICAYIFEGAFWKRAVIFLSSMPITVLMNSFRIGVIGVLVEYWGIAQAEGFIHNFEGWAVFMACFGIIVGEIWILTKIGADRLPFREAFGLDLPEPRPKDGETRSRSLPKQHLAVIGLLALAAISSFFISARPAVQPARMDFATFPMKLDGWQGKREQIEKIYLDVLRVDDYILADFVNANQGLINFYVAYYVAQNAGESAHSPRACIPGDGWQIKNISQYDVLGSAGGAQVLKVNRLIIQKGDARLLVYYWFQQRGRSITNEFMVKWYLFWDALTRNRTDGAMVRLTTPLMPSENIAEADKRLAGFVTVVGSSLNRYIPD